MGITNDAARIHNKLTGENFKIAAQHARRETIRRGANMADHDRSGKKFANGVALKSVTCVSLGIVTTDASDARRVALRVPLNLLRFADTHSHYL